MGILGIIIYAVVMLVLSYALAPDPESPTAAKESDFNVPTAEEGRSVQVIFGKRRVKGPNVIDSELIRVEGVGRRVGNWLKSSYVIIAYRYWFNMHFIVGYTCDGIKSIWSGDKWVWPNAPHETYTEATDDTTSSTIDALYAYGGEDKAGGITGEISIQYGSGSQDADEYLTDWRGEVPAYRGLSGVIFRGVNMGQSTSLPPISFVVKRTDILTSGEAQWYSAKANLNDDDLNAIHIIREALTDVEWGMHWPAANCDSTSFEAAADTCYDEDFGLSLVWDAQSSKIETFINDVLKHIDGHLAMNMATGRWIIKLVRDDYSIPALDTFDESDVIDVVRFERGSPGEVANTFIVRFHDKHNSCPASVTDQDIALMYVEGGDVITAEYEYPGICHPPLASKVVARERQGSTSMLAVMQLECKRTMIEKVPGDVFVLNLPNKVGFTGMVVRVIAVDYGQLKNNRIVMDVAEDVFALGTALYATSPGSDNTDGQNAPVETTLRQFLEIPYYELVKAYGATKANAYGDDSIFFGLIADRPVSDAFGYDLMVRDEAGAAFYYDGARPFTPRAVLVSELPKAATSATIALTDTAGIENVQVGTWALIDDEIVYVTAVDTSVPEVTISRGCLDTVPEVHNSSGGAIIWFVGSDPVMVDREYDVADTPAVKILTKTNLGILDEDTASIYSPYAFDNRHTRPYCPGNVKVNGTLYLESMTGQPTISWGHKDRTLLVNDVPIFTDTTVAAESSVTYVLKIYDEDNSLVRTVDPATSPYVYSEVNERADCGLGSGDSLNTQLSFELYAKRGTFESWQSWSHTVDRVLGIPSESPSVSPSSSPSGSPSVSPSSSPTVSPSVSPSGSPSASLSASVSPSTSPSVSESDSESVSPSVSPSASPSA